ncbi:hypothetical protein [Sphingomonas sp.]|uniref:hypothetical protein n=1 Tax=Sphingomonas sp. TaxID=28214 RepID=UPI00286A2357|nr:hypothetical protein [Sphingomonas sp.]
MSVDQNSSWYRLDFARAAGKLGARAVGALAMFRLMKVNPPHGWSAVVWELLIVTLGVLIALGAQQVIENISDRQRADDAMDAIRSEVADHEFSAAEIEIAAPCIAAQIDAIQKRLVDGDPKPLQRYSDSTNKFGFVVRMPNRVWGDTSWQSIGNTDVLRQLEPAFYNRVAAHYAQVSNQRDVTGLAKNELADLSALSKMMPRGESDRLRLLQTAEQVRIKAANLDLVAGQIRDRLAIVRLLPHAADLNRQLADSGTIKFCRAHGYPLAPLRPADPLSKDI